MKKCYNCQTEIDTNKCPNCGTYQSNKAITIVGLLAPIMLVTMLLLPGCMLRKYGYRQHRNHVAQEVIQYEHCNPKRAHINQVNRHFSERPKSHRPFND